MTLLRTLVLTATLLSGCTARLATHLVTHDVEETLLQREPPVATAFPTDIEVRVAPLPFGLNLRDGSDVDDVDYRSFEVRAGEVGPNMDYSHLLQRVHDVRNTRQVVQIADFEHALGRALHDRMARVGATVVTGEQVQTNAIVVRPHLDFDDGGVKRAYLRLAIYQADGQVEDARGDGVRYTRRHYAWSVPLTMLSFPVGMLIARALLRGIHAADGRRAIALAIVDGADAVARWIATHCREGRCGPAHAQAPSQGR